MPLRSALRLAASMLRGRSQRGAAAARGAALSPAEAKPFDALVDELAHSFGVVVHDDDFGTHVGLLERHRAGVLEQLARFAARTGARFSSHWAPALPAARARPRFGAHDVPAHELRLAGKLLSVDYWREQPTMFVSPREDALLKRIYRTPELASVFRPGARTELAALFPCPTDRAPSFDVDVVYTWVNDADPSWRALYARYAPTAAAAARDSLFSNTDEIRYSLRSLAHAPWVRRVYFVTNCDPPAWLDLAAPRLHFVRHEALLPVEGLPTFNSHAIEACLHLLPGLSEHFLYLNDDMFFLSRVSKSDFFLSNGASKSFLEPYGLITRALPEDAPDFMLAARNGAGLIEAKFGVSPSQLHRHVPYALNRQVIAELEREFPEEFARTRQSRFRSAHDISVPSFLYHHYAYHTQRAIRADLSSHYVIKTADWRARMRRAARDARTQILCINDSESPLVDAKSWSLAASELLASLYPAPSEFELTTP